MFSYNYHFFMFQLFNWRRVNKDWRNVAEEAVVKDREEFHAGMAAKLMHQRELRSLGLLLKAPFLFSTT